MREVEWDRFAISLRKPTIARGRTPITLVMSNIPVESSSPTIDFGRMGAGAIGANPLAADFESALSDDLLFSRWVMIWPAVLFGGKGTHDIRRRHPWGQANAKCPSCGEALKSTWKVCPACETRLGA